MDDRKHDDSSKDRKVALTAAQIAQGALSGGPYGAAAAAASHAAPALFKIAGYLMMGLICLPLLFLIAIPCNLFGAPSAASPDIKEMTAQAEKLSMKWKEQRTLEQKAIDEFVSLLPEDLGFVSIEKNLGNTNDYWMIAITSVHSQQDVRTIDEEKIIAHLQAKLKYELKPKYEDNKLIGYVLVISDLTPEELMSKLGMEEQQKIWAEVVYNTIADSEYSAPGGSLENTTDGEYADLVFTGRGNSREVVYFSQYDSRWGSLMYGYTNTIAGAGCGPTSLAICVSTLTNKTVTPDVMCAWSFRNGYRCEGSGSYHSLIPDGAAHYGVPCEGLGQSKSKLIEALQNGKLVIAIMDQGHFTRGGHFIVLCGITDAGKVIVADCASYERSQKEWNVDIFTAECNKGAAAGGPFWALG